MRNSADYITAASGVRLPRLLYGTAWKKDQTQRLVAEALRQGFRGVDTACQPKHYDEDAVGLGVAAFLEDSAAQRADLYLQTKFTALAGHDPERIPYDAHAPLAEQVAQSFDVSLRQLRTSYVDALLLHSPLPDGRQTEEAWHAMEQIAGSGSARQLGISNCYSPALLETLYRWADVKPAVVQNRFYRESGYDREIRAFCRTNGIVYQSFWTLTANRHVLGHPVLQALSARHERTPAQIFFRCLTQEDIVPLTGTTSVEHMREDLSIFDFTLTEAERAEVSALLQT